MPVQFVNNYGFSNPNFNYNSGVNTKINNKIPESKDENNKISDEKLYSKKQVGGVALATALSAAILGGTVMYIKVRRNIKWYKNENEVLSQIADNAKKILKEELEKSKNRLTQTFDLDIENGTVQEKLYSYFKNIRDNKELEYDLLSPPLKDRNISNLGEAIVLPENVSTLNRSYIKSLDIPEIGQNGNFDYMLPMTNEVKITKMPTKEFTPISHQVTNITESYADSVQWNNDKIVRDILQNFFDGHGQTLDGVQFKFSPSGNGKYIIRIQGKSTYTADKAIYIGESTKRENIKAAGNYGEGLKMSVLKILKDGGSENVKIASDNWRVTYSLGKSDISDKRVLVYSLDNVDKFDGNYLEFETTDRSLLETFRKSINRFYNAGNEHFKCPDIENNIIAIKNLPPNEKGGIYIAGQRFEYDDNYDSLGNVAFMLKQKPPIDVLDPSRDRTSLNVINLCNIAKWISKTKTISSKDKVDLLRALEPYWGLSGELGQKPVNDFAKAFVEAQNPYDPKCLKIIFPEKYIAYSYTSDEILDNLAQKGYVICNSEFSNVGMKNVRDFLKENAFHNVVNPTPDEKKKIILLKEALNSVEYALKNEDFLSKEIDTKVYLFNRCEDSKFNEDTLGEAIIDNGVSKGFWIDKTYLDKASFGDIFETALHELSHKVGGDGSMSFSYKLTNVNKSVISQVIENTETLEVLKAINKLWNEIGQNSNAVA